MSRILTSKDVDYIKKVVVMSAEVHRDMDIQPGIITHDFDGIVDDILQALEFGEFISVEAVK